MSNTRYIEIDSSFRNRKQWPNAAQFEILIAQSGRKDRLNAQDPVSLSAPQSRIWTSNSFDKTTPSSFVMSKVLDITNGIGGSGDNKTIIEVKSIIPGAFQEIENYYVGAIANNTDAIASSRITAYVWLGSDRAQITVEGFSKSASYNDTIVINDPTDVTSDSANAFVFLPNGRNGINAYPGFILYNETNNTYSNILSYDTVTKILRLNITGNIWLNTNSFSIRKETPQIGSFNNPSGGDSSSIFSLPTTFTNVANMYRNSYITVGTQTRLITRYETFTDTAQSGSTTTQIIFSDIASSVNDYYTGCFIQSGGEVRKIVGYTVVGLYPKLIRTAIISPAFTSMSGGTNFTFRTGFVEPSFDTQVFTNGANFQILAFSYDNNNPFVYTGSMTSQQEIACYQIELLDLILPNKILNCGVGSRIAFYPYLYVELSNISGSSAGMKNSIYSNNPNATSMIFRAPIYDVQNPIASSFVKLDGDGMVQTLKFKPNDNLFFSVYLSNGELFQTLEPESYGPLPPNPDIQISALFSFKRL